MAEYNQSSEGAFLMPSAHGTRLDDSAGKATGHGLSIGQQFRFPAGAFKNRHTTLITTQLAVKVQHAVEHGAGVLLLLELLAGDWPDGAYKGAGLQCAVGQRCLLRCTF